MRVRNVKRDTQPDYKSPTRTNYNSENVIDENGTGKKKKKKNRLKFNKKMYLVLSLDRSKSFGWRTVFGSMSRTHHLLKTFKQPERKREKETDVPVHCTSRRSWYSQKDYGERVRAIKSRQGENRRKNERKY